MKLLKVFYAFAFVATIAFSLSVAARTINTQKIADEAQNSEESAKNAPHEQITMPEMEMAATVPEFGFDFDNLVRVVGAEARSESAEMQMLVAQTIYNRAVMWNMSVDEVVSAKDQYAEPMPQGYDGGEMVNESCLRVFACGERITDEPITFFYSTAGGFYSAWHEENLEFVLELPNNIGGTTRFFK